jgi:hypothetical protein
LEGFFFPYLVDADPKKRLKLPQHSSMQPLLKSTANPEAELITPTVFLRDLKSKMEQLGTEMKNKLFEYSKDKIKAEVNVSFHCTES